MTPLTPDELAAARALMDNAALGDWFVEEVTQPSGLVEWDVYEAERAGDVDANSMALCYEESVAKFIAAAPPLVRKLLDALEANGMQQRDHSKQFTDMRFALSAARVPHIGLSVTEAIQALAAERDALEAQRVPVGDEALATLRGAHERTITALRQSGARNKVTAAKYAAAAGADYILALEDQNAALEAQVRDLQARLDAKQQPY